MIALGDEPKYYLCLWIRSLLSSGSNLTLRSWWRQTISNIIQSCPKHCETQKRLSVALILLWGREFVSIPLWRYGMKTLSALLALCEGNPPITGGFPPHKWSVIQNFDIAFAVSLNKLDQQLSFTWFEMTLPPFIVIYQLRSVQNTGTCYPGQGWFVRNPSWGR